MRTPIQGRRKVIKRGGGKLDQRGELDQKSGAGGIGLKWYFYF